MDSKLVPLIFIDHLDSAVRVVVSRKEWNINSRIHRSGQVWGFENTKFDGVCYYAY